MGLNPLWQEDVFLTVQGFYHQAQIHATSLCFIINCNDHFFIHLVPLKNNFLPKELLALQDKFSNEGKQLVHLWEDIWITKRNQVLSRIHSFLGLNQTIHGRKTTIVPIGSKQAAIFFNQYHLQGFVKAKYTYGLLINTQLVAAASFSDVRPMTLKSKDYTSAELIRFASKDGFTVTGGLSKLINHFVKIIKPSDVMSYADRDWSLGNGYMQLNFELTTITDPAILYLDENNLIRYFPHRVPKNILLAFEAQKDLSLVDYLTKNGFIKLFNTGNLKYHLYV